MKIDRTEAMRRAQRLVPSGTLIRPSAHEVAEVIEEAVRDTAEQCWRIADGVAEERERKADASIEMNARSHNLGAMFGAIEVRHKVQVTFGLPDDLRFSIRGE